MEKKILDNLIVGFEFDKEKLRLKFRPDQESSHLKFLKIFSIVEEKTPELIWND